MRTHSIWAAAMMCFVSVTALAQDRLRSASLPERASDQPPSTERDLFQVPPDFYNRPPDPGPSRLFFPQPLPTLVGPGWYADSYRPPRIPTGGYRAVRPTRTEATLGLSLAPASPLPLAAPPPPPLPGKPKTFYVIPGCYAGDKPPQADWPPAGCDMSRMRMVPPQ